MAKPQNPYQHRQLLKLKITMLTLLLGILCIALAYLWVKFMVAIWTMICNNKYYNVYEILKIIIIHYNVCTWLGQQCPSASN